MPRVLLTGANGFVAVAILQVLLEKGHEVVGTVRSESKTTFLRNKFSKFVDGGKLRFAIVEDIVPKGAFDDVLKTYTFDSVIHTSSPSRSDAKDIQTELLDPAISGTTSILESIRTCAPTVKRVVITASIASIITVPKGNWPGKVYSEQDWNPITLEEALSDPLLGYVGGKLFAERAAFDFVEKNKPHFSITTLCPPIILGPPEHEITSLKKISRSLEDIYDVFSGATEPRYSAWAWADSRDVARAHVAAIDCPAAANQRYLISAGNYSPQYIADYIWKHYPERAIAKGIKKGTPGVLYPEEGVFAIDNSKSVKDLGMSYNDFDSMMKDTLKKFEELEAEGK
ncbi:methylglyoxal reductase (NADPH-dependent) gre2 [Tulasnella sp. 424]|nr:methylglyoxal reductase (NADPH-dependent) gre2 [Tulasnella sp. 424]KAG8969613.1 methylglyoxal reductase (NADPH-dependent) gre2 [Tulasnella sp. 425]